MCTGIGWWTRATAPGWRSHSRASLRWVMPSWRPPIYPCLIHIRTRSRSNASTCSIASRAGGLGKLLMSHAIERARAEGAPRLLLGVYSENAGAIAFYRRLGFETIGHRPFTVGTMVCDDFIMSLVL